MERALVESAFEVPFVQFAAKFQSVIAPIGGKHFAGKWLLQEHPALALSVQGALAALISALRGGLSDRACKGHFGCKWLPWVFHVRAPARAV